MPLQSMQSSRKYRRFASPNYLKSEVAITLRFHLCSAHYKQRTVMRSVSAINPVAMENMGNRHNSQHSHREATSHYCESTPYVVRKELEHKGGQRQVHDVSIVYSTAVGEKAHLVMK